MEKKRGGGGGGGCYTCYYSGMQNANSQAKMFSHSFLTKMDIRSYSGASTSQAANSSDSEDSRPDSSDRESSMPSPSPPPSKKACSKRSKCHLNETTKRKYFKSWEKDYSWLYYDEDREGASCKVCKQFGTSSHVQRSGGVWVTKPFKNWKKAVEKLKAHARSDSHSHATATLLAAKRAAKDETAVQQLQNVEAQKRNRAALKCLILVTHFLTKEHVAHSTGKFEKLVDVVVRCGSQRLKQFLETAPRNAVNTSRVQWLNSSNHWGHGWRSLF